MPTLGDVTSHLQESATTYATDLSAVDGFISDLTDAFSGVRQDVFVKNAVVELHNGSGYSVGHLIWDVNAQSLIFAPSDGKDS